MDELYTLLGGNTFADNQYRLATALVTDRWAYEDLYLARLDYLRRLASSVITTTTIAIPTDLMKPITPAIQTIVDIKALENLITQLDACRKLPAKSMTVRKFLGARIDSVTTELDQQMKLFLKVGTIPSVSLTYQAPYTAKIDILQIAGPLTLSDGTTTVDVPVPFGSDFTVITGPFNLGTFTTSFVHEYRSTTTWSFEGESSVSVTLATAADLAAAIIDNTPLYASVPTGADIVVVYASAGTGALINLIAGGTIWEKFNCVGRLTPFYSARELHALIEASFSDVSVTETWTRVSSTASLTDDPEYPTELVVDGLNEATPAYVEMGGQLLGLVHQQYLDGDGLEVGPPKTYAWSRTGLRPAPGSSASDGTQSDLRTLRNGYPENADVVVPVTLVDWTLYLTSQVPKTLTLTAYDLTHRYPDVIFGVIPPIPPKDTITIPLVSLRTDPIPGIREGDTVGGATVVTVNKRYTEFNQAPTSSTASFSGTDLVTQGRQVASRQLPDLWDIYVAAKSNLPYDSRRLQSLLSPISSLPIPSGRRSVVRDIVALLESGKQFYAFNTLMTKSIDEFLALTEAQSYVG